LALVLLLWLWQPVSGGFFNIQDELIVWAFRFVAVFGLAVAGLGVISIDSSELSGTRQVKAFLTGQSWRGLPFQEPGIYRSVRHPMQLGILIFLWATPMLSFNHALFAASMTVYILVGLFFEERGLVAEFGQDYQRYQARVPMLVPFIKHRS
jgi:protein-S-isoprenylcysteine O-methyltransferase Ste14